MKIKGMKKAALGLLAAGALGSGAASAQMVTMAADKAGSTFNTVGSAIATVITEHSKLRVVLRPYSGPLAWAPVVDGGSVDLGVMSANSGYQAFTGKNETKKAFKNLRLLRSGEGALSVGFIVRKDSDIRSFADLRGKRVASDYGGHLSVVNGINASLKIGGLEWSDVRPVPVVGANDGIEALVNGRVDASWASLGQPAAREADVQVGIRYLGAPNTPEAEKIYQEMVFPGARLAVAKPGVTPGVVEDAPMLSYDAYLVGHKGLSDERVKEVLEALWAGSDKLPQYHRSLHGFTNEAAVTTAPVIPYHPAAVEFYREKGLWSEADEARQQALLKQAEAQ